MIFEVFTMYLPQSGAIMGVMTMVVTKWPADLYLRFIFFPFVSIPAIWVKLEQFKNSLITINIFRDLEGLLH